MILSKLSAVEYYLPDKTLSNEELINAFPDWSVEKIYQKTGVKQRHITSENECASDLAAKAAEKLFRTHNINPNKIDFLLLCTQSPDYFLPTTACILQDRLNIPITAGALDFNLGCSGYIYGLSLAKGLIETQQAKNVLLLTSETYSKYIKEDDRSIRTIFGDAAAATLITATEEKSSLPLIGPFIFGTDGRGAKNLIVKSGAARNAFSQTPTLHMSGPSIFTFTLKTIPDMIEKFLSKTKLTLNDIDKFIFHQANSYMLEHLRKKTGIAEDRFIVYMEEIGNTVSSTIPIALSHAIKQELIAPGEKTLLVGFGVGYSWGVTLVTL